MSASKRPTLPQSKGVAARRSELGRLEKIIQKGSRTFWKVGLALAKIRDERLYELEGYATFEDYYQKALEAEKAKAEAFAQSHPVPGTQPT